MDLGFGMLLEDEAIEITTVLTNRHAIVVRLCLLSHALQHRFSRYRTAIVMRLCYPRVSAASSGAVLIIVQFTLQLALRAYQCIRGVSFPSLPNC